VSYIIVYPNTFVYRSKDLYADLDIQTAYTLALHGAYAYVNIFYFINTL